MRRCENDEDTDGERMYVCMEDRCMDARTEGKGKGIQNQRLTYIKIPLL